MNFKNPISNLLLDHSESVESGRPHCRVNEESCEILCLCTGDIRLASRQDCRSSTYFSCDYERISLGPTPEVGWKCRNEMAAGAALRVLGLTEKPMQTMWPIVGLPFWQTFEDFPSLISHIKSVWKDHRLEC